MSASGPAEPEIVWLGRSNRLGDLVRTIDLDFSETRRWGVGCMGCGVVVPFVVAAAVLSQSGNPLLKWGTIVVVALLGVVSFAFGWSQRRDAGKLSNRRAYLFQRGMVLPHTGANVVPGAAGESSPDDARRAGWFVLPDDRAKIAVSGSFEDGRLTDALSFNEIQVDGASWGEAMDIPDELREALLALRVRAMAAQRAGDLQAIEAGREVDYLGVRVSRRGVRTDDDSEPPITWDQVEHLTLYDDDVMVTRRGGAPERVAYGFTVANLELAMEAMAYARSLAENR